MTHFYLKIYVVIVCFLVADIHVWGQCASTPPDQYIHKFQKYAKAQKQPDEEAGEAGIDIIRKKSVLSSAPHYEYGNMCFALRLHFTHKSIHVPDSILAQFKETLRYVNDKFRGANIEFVIEEATHWALPEFETVNSKNPYLLHKLCQGERYDKHCINVYIVESIFDGDHAEAGFATFPNDDLNLNAVFIRVIEVGNYITVAHELGHFFGLFHTFENFGKGETIGDDGMDDTNEDPYYTVKAQKLGYCTSNVFKYEGKNYHLPIDNLMSYYSDCESTYTKQFSQQQLSYMRYVAMSPMRRNLRKMTSEESTIKWESGKRVSMDALVDRAAEPLENRKKAIIIIAHDKITWCNRTLGEMDKDHNISSMLGTDYYPIVVYPEKMTAAERNDFLGNLLFTKNRSEERRVGKEC